ncbi:hypothetical protein JF546_09725 [Nitratireductor aquimarinus]|uniref:hypothetical protein n=1 Tax=Nitratireductor aquimarinus TaxID=889300 RepID=UPI001A8FBED2|nr:hypothetical protein [Nitratireductor aquimarinus]MBN8243288.1 hypothetical protein [Nitratireductor aquimarinus]MBY6131189.1 hypothetical protein [Nitratireductor aquimarinus]MCA1302055.1 hypothetical protein [Nitratireductor aquimarinus]
MRPEICVDPDRPIADGVPFDDLFNMPLESMNALAARDVVFLTEFRADERTYGGSIICGSIDDAEARAFGRGLGERVIGTLTRTSLWS